MYRMQKDTWLLLLMLSTLLFGCTGQDERVALGTLERDRIAHTATVSEVVIDLPVEQGQWVEKGTVLVRLDTQQQTAILEHATADVAVAEANLDKLRNGARVEEVAAAQARMASANAAFIESELSLTREKNLIKTKLTSEAAVDRAQARRDEANANYHNAQEQLRELTNGTRVEDLRMGEAQLSAANAQLASETKKLRDLTIIATRNGYLDNLPWNLGERVTVGSPVAVLLAGDAPYARVYIPEPFRVKINIGTSLQVHIDGLDQSMTGNVRWISHEPAYTPYYALNQQERSRLMYLAEVQLPDSAAELPSGVPVQVVMP